MDSTTAAEPLLVLWDIDHTLLSFSGVGREAYDAVLRRAIGQPMRMTFEFGGLTELGMLHSVLRHHDVEPDEALVAAMFAHLVEEHRGRADHMAAQGTLLAGAAEALRALDAVDGVRQTVLTGNLPSIAALKLELFGLDRWLDVAIGAFGHEDLERPALVPRVWKHVAEHRGQTYSPAQTVLVGDTVRDVEAALVNGTGIVAVASGFTTAEQLRNAGATIVLDSLADTAGVVEAVRAASVPAGDSGH